MGMVGNRALAAAVVLMTMSAPLAQANSSHTARGLNLPSQHADTNQGNFLPGVFRYAYNMRRLKQANFTALRLGVNVETAHDPATLQTLRGYADAFGSEATVLVCMWDTLLNGQTGHGDGKVNNVTQMAAAWKILAAAFESPNVRFEVFNEPFGYTTADEYMQEMESIITKAGLPRDRVVLDGMGYADNIQSIADRWGGWLAFHIYPNWLPDGERTQANFSNLVQQRLSGLSHRTFITEFGAALNKPVSYEKFDPSGHDGDVNMLRGLNDAVDALRRNGAGIAGAFYWHGWDNGDSYSFWGPGYRGKPKIERILREA